MDFELGVIYLIKLTDATLPPSYTIFIRSSVFTCPTVQTWKLDKTNIKTFRKLTWNVMQNLTLPTATIKIWNNKAVPHQKQLWPHWLLLYKRSVSSLILLRRVSASKDFKKIQPYSQSASEC